REFEREFEIFEIGLLIGIDENHVEGPLACRHEFIEQIEGWSFAHFDRPQEFRAGNVAPGDFYVEMIDFKGDHMAVFGQRATEPNCAITAERADFQDTPGAGKLCEYIKKLAKNGRYVDVRQPCVPHFTQRAF